MLSLSGAVYQGVFKILFPDILVFLRASVAQQAPFCSGWDGREGSYLLSRRNPGGCADHNHPKLQNYSNLVFVLGIIVGGFLTSLLAIMKFIAEEQTELAACFLADGKFCLDWPERARP